MNPTYPCEICQKNVEETHEAIECDCNTWYHIQCAGVTKKQYRELINDKFKFSWICKTCFNLRPKLVVNHDTVNNSQSILTEEDNSLNAQTSDTNQKTCDRTIQLNKIIELLMEDIRDLKQHIDREKAENVRLSEVVVKKMEVIYKLEQTICGFFKESSDSPNCGELETGPTKPTYASMIGPNYQITKPNYPAEISNPPMEKKQNLTEPAPNPLGLTKHKNDEKTPEILLIGDSTLRAAASMLKSTLGPTVDTKIKPGAVIRDISQFFSQAHCLPDKVVINVGSNNIATAKTPNHIMRPLWYTIEAGKKRFNNVEWYVSGILPRADIRDKYIHETNEALNFMCNQLGATYIDTSLATDDKCYQLDGIHPNKIGASTLAGIILKTLKPNEENPYLDPSQRKKTEEISRPSHLIEKVMDTETNKKYITKPGKTNQEGNSPRPTETETNNQNISL